MNKVAASLKLLPQKWFILGRWMGEWVKEIKEVQRHKLVVVSVEDEKYSMRNTVDCVVRTLFGDTGFSVKTNGRNR